MPLGKGRPFSWPFPSVEKLCKGEEHAQPFVWGWDKYLEKDPEILALLDEAGAQVIIDEVQQQLEASALENRG